MNFLPKEIVFAAGMIAAPALIAAGAPGCETPAVRDERMPILRNFFAAFRSPLKEYAGEFISAADKHGLDWRLMPSLVIIETGGRHFQNNNIFGWANGASRFPSIANTIEVVAKHLTIGSPYRGKTFEDKMKAYNPRRADYGEMVRKVMVRIAPEPAVIPPAAVN
jgi:hypothetical protein